MNASKKENVTIQVVAIVRTPSHYDLTQWIKFFLTGVIEISKKGVETFDAILQLQKNIENKLQQIGKKTPQIQSIIDALYTQPIVDYNFIAGITKKSKATNYRLIDRLMQLGVLQEITTSPRNKMYAFAPYLDLFKS